MKNKLLLPLLVLGLCACEPREENGLLPIKEPFYKQEFVNEYIEKQNYETEPYEVISVRYETTEQKEIVIAYVYYYCMGDIKEKEFVIAKDDEQHITQVKEII